MVCVLFASLLAVMAAIGASVAMGQIAIPTVTIGDPDNAADTRVMYGGTSGYGSVTYTYNIGATEVTNAQYAAFLNAKAQSDPYGLCNPEMAGEYGGIARRGAEGLYTYENIGGAASTPVNFVSYWDAARFVNWLQNGQGNGDTETGAYTLTPEGISANTVTRNAGWKWAIRNEDEWYKAAYHQPANLGGDADGDEIVNGSDLAFILGVFGARVANFPSAAPADFNGNGLVDGRDLSVLLANFGAGC